MLVSSPAGSSGSTKVRSNMVELYGGQASFSHIGIKVRAWIDAPVIL
jgi:hypothetical protein